MMLYFARHGESEANVTGVISNRGWQHGLTGKGRLQAQALASRLRGAGIARIYASPLKRTVETAEIVSAGLGLPFERADALREHGFGEIEGCADEESWARHDATREAWFNGDTRACIPGGESYEDLRARFVPFVEQLPPDGGSTLLIGHGGLFGCMLPLVLANVDLEFMLQNGMPNTGLVIAERRPEGLVCVEWCGVKLLR